MDQFIEDIVREAGEAVMKFFGEVGVKYTKEGGASDVVTEADLAANKILTERIRKTYPSHQIISEEGNRACEQKGYVWILDPLDGSRNFSTGVPLFGIMAALAKDGIIERAAIYLPPLKELFSAKRGSGALLNGSPVHSSKQKKWAESYGCGSANFGKNISFIEVLIEARKKDPFWMNAFGSFAVTSTYVASGRRDWFASYNGGVWDYAAGSLILEEAGCKVTNAKGESWTICDQEIVAANPDLHPTLLTLIQKANPEG